jgi:cadmium resistance protein CadD (predicted permease)
LKTSLSTSLEIILLSWLYVLVEVIKKKDKVYSPLSTHAPKEISKRRNKQYLSFLAVAAGMFSNGGDNIGVYTPLFAQYNSISQVTTLIVVFMTMTAVWCTAAYYLVNHPLVASRIRRIEHTIMPLRSSDLEYTI